MTTATIADPVPLGALLLDIHAVGWARRIDQDELDLGSCSSCVLGQVYGEYSRGCVRLGLSVLAGDAIAHGFELGFPVGVPEGARRAAYAALADAWLVEIRARRAPVPVEPTVPAYAAWNCPTELLAVL